MEPQQAKMHLQILKSRIKALKQELQAAMRDGHLADARYKSLQEGLQTIESNQNERIDAIQAKYFPDIEDVKKQIKLAEEMLEKKKEERHALFGYLSGLDLSEKYIDDLKDFNWDTLKKIAESSVKIKDDLYDQNRKAEHLDEWIQRAKQRIAEMNDVLSSTMVAKDRLNNAIKEYKQQSTGWKKTLSLQEKRMNKIQSDNERLNLLIRQCVSGSEPTSDYVTRNVQAKCRSFINSENSEDLLNGLLKFKTRQERIIKLLKYKDKKLGDENNKLQVAKDQTQDQFKFYADIISERRNISLAIAHQNHGETSSTMVGGQPV